MKKTFSISLGGSLFQIEEDGYNTLNLYLEQVKQYFSTYPDHQETMTDIEYRIAEHLQKRIISSKSAAVSLADVEYAMATMGTIDDFRAAEDASSTGAQSDFNSYSETKRPFANMGRQPLMRDRKDRIVAGVASGLAAWLAIDPILVRLLWICFTFGFWFFPAVGGFLIFLYIVLAIAMPEGEPTNRARNKRYFRDPDNKTIAGVAGGIAAYFDADITVVRIALILGIFLGGFSLILYLILWVSSKYAKTPSEKIEMKGDPITLSEIDQKLRNPGTSANPQGQTETVLERLVKIPVLLIQMLLKVLQPIFRVLGIIVGLVLVLATMVGLFSLLMLAISAARGSVDPFTAEFVQMDFDGYDFTQVVAIIPAYLSFMGIGLIAIPLIMIALLGIALMVGKWNINRYATWSLTGLWLILFIGFAVAAAPVADQFRKKGSIETYETLPLNNMEPLSVKIQEVDAPRFQGIQFTIKPNTENDSLVLVQSITGTGATTEIGRKTARKVRINSKLVGNTLILDRAYHLDDIKDFSFQKLNITLMVPPGRIIRLTDKAANLVADFESENLIEKLDNYRLANHLVMYKDNGQLMCLDCKPNNYNDDEEEDKDWDEKVETNVNGVQLDISTKEENGELIITTDSAGVKKQIIKVKTTIDED